MKPAIIVVAYNRPNSLKNLLTSISRANFKEKDIPLVISIDYTNSKEHEEVLNVASEYEWIYGEKKVIAHNKNLGLRNHILSCGDMSLLYGSAIILEDDLRVSDGFYTYGTAALNYYENNKNIGGISLYSYEFEEQHSHTFYPRDIGGDTFFIQWASSWGQAWTANQWKSFREWYSEDKSLNNIRMPEYVKLWGKSWKKYYIAYLVENNRFFAFPYASYTTIRDTLLTEKGTNNKADTKTNHVLVKQDIIPRKFNFSSFDYDELKYDVFFQPITKNIFIKELNKEVLVEFDFYGSKEKKHIIAPYLFSSKKIKTNELLSYSNKLLPYENNLIYDEKGLEFNFGKTDNFSFKKLNILDKGDYLYHTRKSYSMKENLLMLFFKLKSIILK